MRKGQGCGIMRANLYRRTDVEDFIMRAFRDFAPEERRNYITLSTGEYYPDILEDACRLYMPVLETFSQLLKRSESSAARLHVGGLFKN